MIIDTISPLSSGALNEFKSAGGTGVIKYYCPNTAIPSKRLTRSDAELIIAAGLTVGAVYEVGAAYADFSSDLGSQAGEYALEYASTVIGQPQGSAIYFAIDYDETGAHLQSNVAPYFQAIKTIIGGYYKIGCYGNGLVLQTLLDAGLIDYAWLSESSAFTGTKDFLASGRWHLHQSVSKPLFGLVVDTNTVGNSGIWGGFSALSPI
ncbi:DUF1906 domain-containing protein [Acidisoma cellulosilytica]|uniref:DUF1906 domain-containing protein n=1 Tax=Acidisoma cellulosilyticum TaxID=2802395 RepID=A0A963Z2T9_9PROT|nr:DUF1906 domain-containing protein [Acidisoma cellulosilyticum]MCB8881704.1 DUF1906 domain-containing protein [Acidisoma cellulosilyticum]